MATKEPNWRKQEHRRKQQRSDRDDPLKKAGQPFRQHRANEKDVESQRKYRQVFQPQQQILRQVRREQQRHQRAGRLFHRDGPQGGQEHEQGKEESRPLAPPGQEKSKITDAQRQKHAEHR